MSENETEAFNVDEDLEDLDFAAPERQKLRAFLRERFLRIITGIVGKQAEFLMYGNTNVKAEFRGCDVDCREVFVRNLQTPIGTIPDAILRRSDILYFTVSDVEAE